MKMRDYISPEIKNVVIFGYSELGIEIYNQIKKENLNVNIVFCDNSPKKQGISQSRKIISVEEAATNYKNGLYFIASKYHAQTMKEQLLALKIPNERIMDKIFTALNHFNEKQIERKWKKRTELEFEVAITDHCNLNCRSCNAFSPLATEKYLDLDVFEKDFKRLSVLFQEESGKISLLGGEPLLNKRICEYMEIARKYFPKSEIVIITNGILLNNMEQYFWEECNKLSIGIIITRYPIKINIEEIQKKAEQFKVKWEYYGNALENKYMFLFPLDLSGKQNAEQCFNECMNANKCITLRHGKLFTCSTAAYASHFFAYFRKKNCVSENDCIDIYQCNDKEAILKFLSRPIPFCRYCDVRHRDYERMWDVSKRDIKEWTL